MKPSIAERIYFLFLDLRVWFCNKFLGHDIVDEGYGGPESGCMAGYCKRCGWSYHHQLY